MKKLSLVFSLLAMFAISTINAQAPVCKMEAGKCIITNADGTTTTTVDAKDCAVKCDATAAASTDCAKKCTAAKSASTTATCSKKSASAKTVSTTAKSAQAQTVNFLPTAKATTEKKCTSAKSACCAKDAKKKSGTK